MRGLLVKAVRETWLATLLAAAALLVVEIALNVVLPQIQGELNNVWLQLPFAKGMVTALLGVEMDADLSPGVLYSIVWVHPVVLALLWAHEILFCTRLPAAEIDRGTVDVLLSLPVPRRTVYLCESAVWIGSGVLLLAAGFAGFAIGARTMPAAGRADAARTGLVLLDLLCVYFAVGGTAYLVSALSDRRGKAAATVFGLVLASFLLNFLAQFWDPAKRLAFLGILHYYQPAQVLARGTFPLGDAAVLVGVGAVTWAIGAVTFERRSICTV